MMRAIVLTKYGPPSGLRLETVEKPAPGDDEVLVKIEAAGVNDWEWGMVRGRPLIYRLMTGLRRPRIPIPGVEIAGTVEAVGASVTSLGPGDHVYGDTSEAGHGAFAEYVGVRQDAVYAMAPGMTFVQAAALPHAGMLAYQGLVGLGQIQEGARVLINGAGGGVGIVGVHIAKQFGAEVTGVDSALKLEAMTAAGFDHVIDYRAADFTRNGERYDLILDTKTTRSPFRHLRSLADGGRYVTVGGKLPRLLQTFLLGRMISRMSSKNVQVVALRPNSDLDYINSLFESSGLRPVIDGPYPLSEVPSALARFGEAAHVGKVVIAVGDSAGDPVA